jgi:hypothetical protein
LSLVCEPGWRDGGSLSRAGDTAMTLPTSRGQGEVAGDFVGGQRPNSPEYGDGGGGLVGRNLPVHLFLDFHFFVPLFQMFFYFSNCADAWVLYRDPNSY